MARRRRNRFINQAALEALVRFGPELSGLKALQREALSTYSGTVAGARGAADYISQEARNARPQAKKDWKAAGLAAARSAHDTLGSNQPSASPGNSAVQNAILGEQAGIQARIAESQGNELQDLREVGVRAQQGAAWAQTSARNDLVKALSDIGARRQDLARERGAFTVGTAQELRQAAQDRADKFKLEALGNAQSDRNSLRSAGIDPDTGKPIPGGELDPNSPRYKDKGKGRSGGATATQIAAAQDQTQSLLPLVRQFQQKGRSRQQVAAVLSKGFEPQPVFKTDATGKQKRVLNPDGTQKMTAGIPQAKSQLLLSAALDVAYLGYVSRPVAKKLHSRGLSLADLGLPSLTDLRRKRNRGPTERGIAAGTLAGPPAPR